jgi:(2Fe-2S) ferredoxin
MSGFTALHAHPSLGQVKPRFRLSVCKGPDCRARGSDAVFTAIQTELATRQLTLHCLVGRGGCYGLCHFGPNVVVRPDTGRPMDPLAPENYRLMGTPGEVHYAEMTVEKAGELVREHIGEGLPAATLKAPGSV